MFGIFKNLSWYLYSPDACMIMYVFNHEPHWPLWVCFLVPIVHSVLWVAVKTTFFRIITLLFQWRARKRKERTMQFQKPSTWWGKLWRLIKHWAYRAYQWARTLAHSKPFTARALFWFGLEPQLQKAGCAILGILWPRFRWRGYLALCFGGSCQVLFFCLFYVLFGEAIANVAMYCIFVPLGLFAFYRWIRRNGKIPQSQ